MHMVMHFRSNGLGPTYQDPDLGMKVLKMLIGNLAWIFFEMKKKNLKIWSSWHRFGSSIPFFSSLFFVLGFLTIGIVCGSSLSIWV